MHTYLVIKSLAWFPLQCARNSGPVMSAFLQGAKDHHIQVLENHRDADAAVIWSALWAGRMQKNQEVYRHYRELGRPVIIIEVGALRRNVTWKISLNNVNASGIYGHLQNLDPARPARLGIATAPRQRGSDAVIIAAQHHKSLQLEGTDQESWICDQIRDLRCHTDRDIIVRSHPRSPLNVAKLPRDITVQTPRKLPGTYDDFDFSLAYHAVINYCSGPGIQAAVSGTPVVTHSSSLAHAVSTTIPQMDTPIQIDRQQWLIEIAHTEYLLDEIKQATWLKRLNDWL